MGKTDACARDRDGRTNAERRIVMAQQLIGPVQPGEGGITDLHPYNFPEWTRQGVKEHKLGDERSIYVTQDGEAFWSMKDAQEHVQKNYWDPAEIDLPQIIKDLEGTNVKDFGAIPNYLMDNFADPMDSSTWNVPSSAAKAGKGDSEDLTWKKYYSPEDATAITHSNMSESDVLDYIDRQSKNRKDPEWQKNFLMDKFFPGKLPWDKEAGKPYYIEKLPPGEVDPGPWNAMGKEDYPIKHWPYQPYAFTPHEKTYGVNERRNLLDYYASQGNPELKRGMSTGFFPTKYYPEAGIDALRDYEKKGKLFERYTDEDSAGHYRSGTDEIGFDWADMYDTDLGETNYIDRPWLTEIAGHEGIHYNMYPRVRGSKAIQSKLPFPYNYKTQDRWQKVVGHPAMHYVDNLFFPETRRNVSVGKEGFENVKSIMNWEPPTTGSSSSAPGAIDKWYGPGRGGTGASPRDFTQTDYGKAYNTGGIASLVV